MYSNYRRGAYLVIYSKEHQNERYDRHPKQHTKHFVPGSTARTSKKLHVAG